MKVLAQLMQKWPQQVFTHLDDDGTARTFLVETMLDFVQKYPTCVDLIGGKAPINFEIADYLRRKAGIEQHRVDRLVEPYASIPIIGILWPEGTTLIVDGNHRIVRAYEDGKTELNTVLFKAPFWENFMLPNDASRKLVESGALHNHSNIH